MGLPCHRIRKLTAEAYTMITIYDLVNVTTFLDTGDRLGAGGVANPEVNPVFLYPAQIQPLFFLLATNAECLLYVTLLHNTQVTNSIPAM